MPGGGAIAGARFFMGKEQSSALRLLLQANFLRRCARFGARIFYSQRAPPDIPSLARASWRQLIPFVFGVTTSDDYRPVGWIGRYPVRVTSIVCALFVIGMFVTVIGATARWDLSALAFEPNAFLHGAVWQPLTCVLMQGANFFFLFNLFFFYWAGNEVEQFLGVRRYLILLAFLLLVAPLVLVGWWAGGFSWGYFGSYELSVGMFIAFATLYPNIELFGWVTLKWLAFAGLVLASMQNLPNHQWGNLSVLWGMCLVAFVFIRVLQGKIPITETLGNFSPLRRKPKFKVLPKPSESRRSEDDVYESIDPILDKIAKSGIGSLTTNERRQLDRARARLLKESK